MTNYQGLEPGGAKTSRMFFDTETGGSCGFQSETCGHPAKYSPDGHEVMGHGKNTLNVYKGYCQVPTLEEIVGIGTVVSTGRVKRAS